MPGELSDRLNQAVLAGELRRVPTQSGGFTYERLPQPGTKEFDQHVRAEMAGSSKKSEGIPLTKVNVGIGVLAASCVFSLVAQVPKALQNSDFSISIIGQNIDESIDGFIENF